MGRIPAASTTAGTSDRLPDRSPAVEADLLRLETWAPPELAALRERILSLMRIPPSTFRLKKQKEPVARYPVHEVREVGPIRPFEGPAKYFQGI